MKLNKAHTTIEPEPPPPQQKSTIATIEPEPPPNSDETQWIQDVQHSAANNMARIRMCNEIHTQGITYTPFTSQKQGPTRLEQHILYLQRLTAGKPKMPPPRSHPIHMPTPKSSSRRIPHRNILHDTTWKNNDSKDWIKNNTGGWTTQEQSLPHAPPPNPTCTKY